MATINEIATGAQYTGDAAIGGGYDVATEIDTKPLDNLAYYTMAFNKTKWDQKQKDVELQAEQLADMTAYDLTNSIPKFSKLVIDKYNELYSWVQKNPTVLDFRNNQKGWLEYNKKKNEFENDLKDAKAQDIIYKAGMAEIEKEPDALKKADMLKRLNEEVEKVDLKTPIRIHQYDSTPAQLPEEVPTIAFDRTVKDAGGAIIIDRDFKVPNQRWINETSAAFSSGILGRKLDINSPEFKKLNADQQKLAKEQHEARVASGFFAEEEQANILTEALNVYKDADGKIDINALIKSGKMPLGLKSIVEYNMQMEQERKKIQSGVYNDNLGMAFGSGGDALDINDYVPIDISDGVVTAEDIFKVKLRSKAKATSYNTETRAYDDGSTARYNAETARINATKPSGDGTKTNSPEKYDPLGSIIASIGSLNKGVPLSELSIAQVAAINPNYLNEKGELKPGFAKKQISVGRGRDGTFTLFELGEDGKVKDRRVKEINESKLLSNAASWLSTGGKERKGQDAYLFDNNRYLSAIGQNEQNKKETDANGFPTN